jgi:hypothetical protein
MKVLMVVVCVAVAGCGTPSARSAGTAVPGNDSGKSVRGETKPARLGNGGQLAVFECACTSPDYHGGSSPGFAKMQEYAGGAKNRLVTTSVIVCAVSACSRESICKSEGIRRNNEYVEAWQRGRRERDPELDRTTVVQCRLDRGPIPMDDIAREQLDTKASPCDSSRVRTCDKN